MHVKWLNMQSKISYFYIFISQNKSARVVFFIALILQKNTVKSEPLLSSLDASLSRGLGHKGTRWAQWRGGDKFKLL